MSFEYFEIYWVIYNPYVISNNIHFKTKFEIERQALNHVFPIWKDPFKANLWGKLPYWVACYAPDNKKNTTEIMPPFYMLV